jgi:predicted restriction endonuclease
MSPSQAKNAVLRCLSGIIDPYPTKKAVERVWEHFESKCAYCGAQMKRTDRKGHLDHLVSFKDGGANDIGNYVLACGTCNGDEKLEENWECFMRRKNLDDALYLARKTKIEDWVAHNASTRRHIPDDQRCAVLDAFQRIASALEESVADLRRLKPPKLKKKVIKSRRTSERGDH